LYCSRSPPWPNRIVRCLGNAWYLARSRICPLRAWRRPWRCCSFRITWCSPRRVCQRPYGRGRDIARVPPHFLHPLCLRPCPLAVARHVQRTAPWALPPPRFGHKFPRSDDQQRFSLIMIHEAFLCSYVGRWGGYSYRLDHRLIDSLIHYGTIQSSPI
jgi:hypothetical protein